MIWKVFIVDVDCGAAVTNRFHTTACRIPAGEPVALLGEKQLIRCATHAGAPVDWVQIEASRLDLEHEAMAREHTPSTPSQFLARTTPAPPKRHHIDRPLKPFAKVGNGLFDPRAAAAGDRDR